MLSSRELPPGPVTLLFCDIEGSTGLARRLGDEWLGVLGAHRGILRDAIASHDGVELGTEGDGLHAAFRRARDAVAAAADGQRGMVAHRWPAGAPVRVRMGLHTGEPALTPEGYEGLGMHRCARVMAAGHGGQVLLTDAVREAVADRLPVGVAVRDLGLYTLRDFARPDRLFQLVVDGLHESFPPLRSGGGRPTNLPCPPTRVLGRERELSEVAALVRGDGARLVTLTGPGGVGKTRLALELAHELAPAHFVSLASVADPAVVAATLAQSLGIVDRDDVTAVRAVLDALAGEELLLVLDNLEHLLAVGPLVAKLLAECPRVRVLATSREPLRVRGEHVFPVAPLRVPAPGHEGDMSKVEQAPATALFLERVRARDPTFELTADAARRIAEICVRLDGLALAIELAAARIGLLTPAELVARLGDAIQFLGSGPRDAPDRHQTLLATMDWSFRLLNPSERDAFSTLAAFSGGCTVEAAEAVCEAPLATLESLMAKSLLARESGRLTMLETVREYAVRRLAERADADRIYRRHAEYTLSLARRVRPRIRLGDQRAVAILDSEIDNLRGALAWAADHDVALLLELGATLSDYWLASHRRDEGREWVTAALSAADAGPPRIKAELLLARAQLCISKGSADPHQAREALAVFEELGDPAGASRCLCFMSTQETFRTHWHAAEALADRALARARQVGDNLLIGESLRRKSMAQPNFAQAVPIAEEAADYLRRAGNLSDLASLLSTTGFIAIEDEAYERADQLFAEALEAATTARDVNRVAAVRGNQGLSALFQDRIHTAAEAFRDELTLCRDSRFATGSLVWEGLTGLAAVAAAAGEPARAAELTGAASACTENPLNPAETPLYERLTKRFLDPARAALGNSAWDHAHHAGRHFTSDEAIVTALDDARVTDALARPAFSP